MKMTYLPLSGLLLFGFFLVGCATVTPIPLTATRRVNTATATAIPISTPSITPSLIPTDSPTEIDLSPTETATPVFAANGNVTWHPAKELISWFSGGGDGQTLIYDDFSLFWDGTLLQEQDEKYISKLSQDEICKLLNTANQAGFANEPRYYDSPYKGASGDSFGINSWQPNGSGVELFESVVNGAPYYEPEFCNGCQIPTQKYIIQPALANTYFMLRNYLPQNRKVVPPTALLLHIYGVEQVEAKAWPIQSLTLEDLKKRCDSYCSYDEGVLIDGEQAREILQKIPSGSIYIKDFFESGTAVNIWYETAWPEIPDVPADYTLTCNLNGPKYPILPLNPSSKFWYYAPNRKWGAERLENENKMRVVNSAGYEKIYQYNPALFGREAVQIYPRYWSEDGRYFYVNVLPNDFVQDTSLVNSIGLQQIDVQNEKVKYLFIGTKGEPFAYSFSPDGKYVAYIQQGQTPLKLVIVNTVSGDERYVPISSPVDEYTSAGTIVWAEDEKDDKLYFSAIHGSKTDIVMVKPSSLSGFRVIYSMNQEVKLFYSGYYSAEICPLTAASSHQTCLSHYLVLSTGDIH